MKVLHLIHNLTGGGAERQLCYLAENLSLRGEEVHIGYCSVGPQPLPSLGKTHLHRFTVRHHHSPRLLWQIGKLIHQVQPDIIQTWILQMDIAAGLLAVLGRKTWCLREPCSIEAYPPSWKHWLRGWLGKRTTMIIANSTAGANYWKETLQHVDPITVIHNGFPLERIAKVAETIPPRVEMDKENAPLLLFAGRLAEQKNLHNLLLALALVQREGKSFSFVLCGEGPLRQELELLVYNEELDGVVSFAGSVPPETLWGLMKCAQGVVFVSHFEGLPNVVAEAMACEAPLVVSDIPAHRELLDENTAIFVNPDSPESIAAGIRQVLTEQEEDVLSRAQNAQQRVRSLSIPSMAQAFLNVYTDITEMA